MKMNIQYFAEGSEGGDGTQNSSAAPTAEDFQSMQASMAELQKQLNNVSKQRDGLLAKQGSNASGSQSASDSSSSNQPNSSAAPASSSTANDDVLASMQAQMAEMQKQNQELTSQIAANKQRKSFLSQAKKDGISLTDQDLTMISGSNDQDATYKYIKGLKASSKGRQFAPNANIFKRQKDNVGATIAQVDNQAGGLGALIKAQAENKGVN